MQNQKTSLYFTEGSSDKEYHAELVARDGGFAVQVAYGRRGSTLTCGSKTNSPVEYDKAKRIFDKLVAEKKAKGYTEAASGQAYQDAPADMTHTGIVAMLLNAIDEAEAEVLLDDPAWGMEIKYDGERRMAWKNGEGVFGINRKGFAVSLPRSVESDVAALGSHQMLIDGESMGDTLMAFDLLEMNGENIRGLGAAERHQRLVTALASAGCQFVIPVILYTTAEAKRRALAEARANKEEGVVFKRLDAPYCPGCPNSWGDALKLKFVESATVVVTAVNDKRSVAIHVYDDADLPVAIGNVTISPKTTMPVVGAVIEVQYLYAYPTLYQPVYKGPRTDQDAGDCLLAKIKLKKGLSLPLAA